MRELEKIYKDYLDSNKPLDLNQDKFNISNGLKNKIMSMFKQPVNVNEKKEDKKIEEGNVYMFFIDSIPVYFVIYQEVLFETKTGLKQLYEVLKVSYYYELSREDDLITSLNDETIAIETWNDFYLPIDIVRKAIYLGKIKDKDFKILKDYKEEKIKELPENKRGMTTPCNENYFQILFHKNESKIVRDFKFLPLLFD